jgi:hypothetical protein
MANGMEMMLKSFGVDPAKIKAEFETMRTGVTTTLKNIDERLALIEARQKNIYEQNLEQLKLLQEITAWKRVSTHQSLLNPQAQPPTAQTPPPPLPQPVPANPQPPQ